MWSPTHIQVTIQQAKDLLTKGKNDTNNCFVTIGLGKEKYQTSVKEKAVANVEWKEECELKIPDQGNRAELVLTCLHRNNLGIDEFLGQVTLPLNEMDVYDRPRSKWYKLESKASKAGKDKKNKERGQLEVLIAFIVKSDSELNKKDKHKLSVGKLVGGSLLSIGKGEKNKSIKKIAISLGSRMHLHSKKKNKDIDDVSFNSSNPSIGTPTSGSSRNYGQRAGEADPGVISEDEDEFVFDDNLSTKSSGSSLNVRGRLQPPMQHFVPRNPSPLLGGLNGKAAGKELLSQQIYAPQDLVADLDLEQLESDFSVRARTLPPPSKPPRTPQLGAQITITPPTAATDGVTTQLQQKQQQQKQQQLDEWEAKLYSGKHLELGNSDSLKRRSWELARVPLAVANDESVEENEIEKETEMNEEKSEVMDEQLEWERIEVAKEEIKKELPEVSVLLNKSQNNLIANKLEDIATSVPAAPPPKVLPPPNHNLISTELDKNGFSQFNASFAKFEQRNSFDFDTDKKLISQSLIAQEMRARSVPQAMPRNYESKEAKKVVEEGEKVFEEHKRQEAIKMAKQQQQEKAAAEEAQRRRAEEDARLEEELRLNEQRLHEEEQALHDELQQQEEQKRREAKRHEEDQRILNFATHSTSLEEDAAKNTPAAPLKSPTERTNGTEKREKQRLKFKYFGKREKTENGSNKSLSPKSNKRIIIGHEKSTTQAERRSEITAALGKKYEGKSREELMLIANGMENEALLQRQRVKELEDYLDNLLLRVMETHPKILQNPYSRTTSAKSG